MVICYNYIKNIYQLQEKNCRDDKKKIPDEISVKDLLLKINKKKAGPISLKDLAPVQKEKRRKGEIDIEVTQQPPDPLPSIPDVENVRALPVAEKEVEHVQTSPVAVVENEPKK